MSTDTERSPLISDDDLRVAVASLRQVADPHSGEPCEERVKAAQSLLNFGGTVNQFGDSLYR